MINPQSLETIGPLGGLNSPALNRWENTKQKGLEKNPLNGLEPWKKNLRASSSLNPQYLPGSDLILGQNAQSNCVKLNASAHAYGKTHSYLNHSP